MTTIEVLTPNFLRKPGAAKRVVEARPDVYNHNLETVPRLYPTIRPGAHYFASLSLLHQVKQLDPSIFTKSGLMVGLSETRIEIMQVMDDLQSAAVGVVFNEAVRRMVGAFRKRALEVYGPPVAAGAAPRGRHS